ncbi:hypothetical protein GYA19_04985 [Candidatus Beckwithbacteria bacterium]|nr:hypothetical protein [Candidatus Beckwithbacteria bacterium]
MLMVPIFAIFIGILLLFGRDGTFSINRIILPLFVVTIIFPSIQLSVNIPDTRPEFIVIIIGCIFLLFCHLATGNKINIKYQSTNKWFLLFGLSILLSMAY